MSRFDGNSALIEQVEDASASLAEANQSGVVDRDQELSALRAVEPDNDNLDAILGEPDTAKSVANNLTLDRETLEEIRQVAIPAIERCLDMPNAELGAALDHNRAALQRIMNKVEGTLGEHDIVTSGPEVEEQRFTLQTDEEGKLRGLEQIAMQVVAEIRNSLDSDGELEVDLQRRTDGTVVANLNVGELRDYGRLIDSLDRDLYRENIERPNPELLERRKILLGLSSGELLRQSIASLDSSESKVNS